MESLLIDAIHAIRNKFRDNAAIALEAFVDPETATAKPQVIVVAVTPLPFAQADALLDEVIEEWWVANHERAEGRVSLATELV